MDERHLIEVRLSGHEVYKGRLLHAFCDTVQLPDGSQATREYIVHPGAVMIVPLLDQVEGTPQVILERQYRYPLRQVMIEFPAGKLDPGESSWSCARRELLEETGYSASQWACAGRLHPVISYSTEFIDIWFARGLSAGQSQLDQGEFLEIFSASPAQLLDWCRAGQVTDGKTLTAALWLQNVLSGAWSLDWQSDPAASAAG
jgi:ADP-ribose pyrophosphatase